MIRRAATAVLFAVWRVLTCRAVDDLCWTCGWLRAWHGALRALRR